MPFHRIWTYIVIMHMFTHLEVSHAVELLRACNKAIHTANTYCRNIALIFPLLWTIRNYILFLMVEKLFVRHVGLPAAVTHFTTHTKIQIIWYWKYDCVAGVRHSLWCSLFSNLFSHLIPPQCEHPWRALCTILLVHEYCILFDPRSLSHTAGIASRHARISCAPSAFSPDWRHSRTTNIWNTCECACCADYWISCSMSGICWIHLRQTFSYVIFPAECAR